MKNLYPRKKMILDLLMSEDGWVTSTQLASRLDVSDRTVRKEIADLGSDLQSFGLCIASERGKGYSINSEYKQRLNTLIYESKAFTLMSDRPAYVNILIHLVNSDRFVLVDDLCDTFYLSRTAIENDLKSVKKYLECYSNHLYVVRKRNAVCIEGPEKEKRFILNSLIVSDTHSKLSLDLKAYTPYFNYQQLLFCKNTLCKLIGQYNRELQITDISIVAIILHVMIAVQRIQRGYSLSESYVAETQNNFSEKNIELAISNQLWDGIETRFHLSANSYEREAIAYLISFRRVFFADGMTIEDLDCDPTREYLQLTRTIIAELKDVYLLDLTWDNDLIIGLTAHLKSLADRANFRSHYVNPILKDFKDQYPFIFELAIYARRRIMVLKSMLLNEDEVGYLAIHFGASVERLKHIDKQGRIRTTLLCHAGYASSKFLFAKLKSVFGDQLEINGPYSSFDTNFLAEDMPQLILSTTKIELPEDIPLLVINPLLDHSDIRQINKYIAQIEKKNSGVELMRRFFDEDFFFPNLGFRTPGEIIAFIADKLMESGRVLPAFKKLVFEREQFSPTVIQNFIALPHPSAFCSMETTISVATLPRSVDWYGRKVQLVFMMAIKEGDQQYLKSFYEFIVDLSEDPGRVQKLLKINDLDAFWQFMMQDNNSTQPEETN